ncbi:hypothetical protein LWI28_009243 [Acer negundo]|uniref:Uncharacterized protein n=1 Tax=Acer negundo TaxID=4023 RepID=A0AAD5JIP3_ACENE|nr:hypothetical protein LWI28_009243 [Acer negundo]
MVEESGVDIVAMVSMMHIGMITELNMAVGITSSSWWLDSGSTIHVCNDETQYKTYEAVNDDQMVLMGNHNPAKFSVLKSFCRLIKLSANGDEAWKDREVAVLALGAIAEGCISVWGNPFLYDLD